MNSLNTDTGLYDVLRKTLGDASLRSSLSPEAFAVANVFLRDFEKSGIHLPSLQRQRFVDLSNDILHLGRQFMQGQSDHFDPQGSSVPPVKFKRQWFSQLHSNLLSALDESPARIATSSADEIALHVPLCTWESPTILRHAPHAEARRIAYYGMNTANRDMVDVLEDLLKKRGELANLTGYDSFGHMALGDKMAKRPTDVETFLRALEEHHRPVALSKLEELKKIQRGHAPQAPFQPWDKDFYSEQYSRSLAFTSPGALTPISPFFSVGSVFSGLSRMLQSLYGIRLRASTMQQREAWNNDVVKLEVVEEDLSSPNSETIVGTIYTDLFSRAGKPPSAGEYDQR